MTERKWINTEVTVDSYSLKNLSKKVVKKHRITPVLESLLMQLQACSLQLYWKKRLWCRCFIGKFFGNFSKQCFSEKHLRVTSFGYVSNLPYLLFKITKFQHISLYISLNKCDIKFAHAELWRKQIFFLIQIRFNTWM